MPKCCKCKEYKEVTEFYKDKYRNNGYSSRCKNCKRKYSKNSKSKRKKITDNVKTKCIFCGYDRCKSALEFHHLGDKINNISQIGIIQKVKEEISKCIVLCANCHRELHAGLIKVNG